MLRKLVENILFFQDGHKTFFEPGDYPWVAKVEAGTPLIRKELDALLQRRDEIPNFQDLSEKQKPLTEGTQWKTFFLYAYGEVAEQNCAQCPETVRILKCVPNIKTAMFSILAPGKHIPPHRGMYKGMLRYHLGLIIPGAPGACRIRVGDDVRAWEEGKSLVFDDSHEHEAWNDTDSYRVVLFVDLLRPVFFPFSAANRAVVWAISRTGSITEPMERIRKQPPLVTKPAVEATPAAAVPEGNTRAVGRGAGAN
jgi:beta-hydroxylase